MKHPYLFRFGLLTLQAGIVIKQEIYQSFKSDFHMIIEASIESLTQWIDLILKLGTHNKCHIFALLNMYLSLSSVSPLFLSVYTKPTKVISHFVSPGYGHSVQAFSHDSCSASRIQVSHQVFSKLLLSVISRKKRSSNYVNFLFTYILSPTPSHLTHTAVTFIAMSNFQL